MVSTDNQEFDLVIEWLLRINSDAISTEIIGMAKVFTVSTLGESPAGGVGFLDGLCVSGAESPLLSPTTANLQHGGHRSSVLTEVI